MAERTNRDMVDAIDAFLATGARGRQALQEATAAEIAALAVADDAIKAFGHMALDELERRAKDKA